jgi:hypothetical protein
MSNPLPLNIQPPTPMHPATVARGRGLAPVGRGWVGTWVGTWFPNILPTYAFYRGVGRECRDFFENFAYTRKTPKTPVRKTMAQVPTPSTPSTRGLGSSRLFFRGLELAQKGGVV